MYADHERMRELDPHRPADFDQHFRHKVMLDYFGVDYDRIHETFRRFKHGGILAAGEFTRSEVVAGLADTGYEAAETDRGYTVFTRPDDDRVVAATDGTVVQYLDRDERIRGWIDFLAGSAPSLGDTDALFAETTSAAGGYPVGILGDQQLYGGSPSAQFGVEGWTFDDPGTFYRFTAGFSSPEDVDVNWPAAWVTDRVPDHEIAAAETNGRVASVTGFVHDSKYDPDTSVSAADYPLATFGTTYDADAEVVTVRHEGGEPVSAASLQVEVDGLAVEAGLSGKITPGTSVDVSVAPGDRVRAVWIREDNGLALTFAEFEVPK